MDRNIILLLCILPDILVIAASIPFILKRIKPNDYSGFRVAETLSNERVWYLANVHFGKGLLCTGIISVLCSVTLYLSFTSPRLDLSLVSMFLGLNVIALVIGLLVATYLSASYAKRISSEGK